MNVSIPRPEHPNPQMYRESWKSLNGEWLFCIDHGDSGEERKLYAPENASAFSDRINVPFCPESELSGIGIKDYMESVWYKRVLTFTDKELEGRVLLHFGAVDYHARLYVNGEFAGEHFGGFTHFCFDVTKLLHAGENDITLHANDYVKDARQPSGKQSVKFYSERCYYTRTTGIWQSVYVELVPREYIKSFKVYPDIENCSVAISAELVGEGRLTATAYYEGKEVGCASKTGRGAMHLELPLSEKHLWEVGCGRLYDLELKFGDDSVKSYFGLREVRVDGLKVLINGKSVFQRTVLDQGFYPDGILTAPTKEALERDIDLSLAVGFNGARLHQKVFEPLYLYYADKKGYLVWGEHASWPLDFTKEETLLSFLPEWCEAVEFDFNHPAIVGWCPLNETFKDPNKTYRQTVKAIYEATKRLDPTRPVIDSSGGLHVITDIYDMHNYNQDPVGFKRDWSKYNGTKESLHIAPLQNIGKNVIIEGLPLFLSEIGGIKWVCESRRALVPEISWGYGNAPLTEEEFFSRYEGLIGAMTDSPSIMGFCYTQLTDVEQETNGIYNYDRSAKFADMSRIYAANTKKALIED